MPVVAFGLVIGRELNVDVQQRYLDTSRQSGALLAQVGIQPLIDGGMMTDGFTPANIAIIDERLHGAAASQDVRRLKIWGRDGTVLYSDNHELIGKKFEIEEDLAEALEGHGEAGITDGHSPENAGDNLEGPLIEVYVPLVLRGESKPAGAFELYLPYAPVQAAINDELKQLYIVLGAGLIVFYAVLFPVAILAERWRRRLVREAENTALANLAVLERLNKLKSEFLTRISHQFRTSLVGIEGFSELIRDSDDLDLDKVRAFAGDIHDDAERLDRAFADMLELDRMEAGKSVLKVTQVNLGELIEDAIGEARRDGQQGQVTTALDGAARTVPADREKLKQLLTILVGNALKYSPAGAAVTVRTELGEDEVTVSVEDRGPGMPSDFDNGLFVGYRKTGGGATNGSNGAGTGLGLPIARQIVEMHGGRIWFDSKPGEGSTFHFTLPLRLRPSRQMMAVVRA